jgi:ABC-type uncharacterized transport system ATPase subunit
MKMILGLVKPTKGEVSVFGKKLNDNNRLEILKHTGSLIESPSYYGHLSGRENLEIIQMLKGVPKEEIKLITPEGEVNQLLMKFLDATSFNKKLEVISSNRKYIDDRLINDMAVALDCTVEDGPLDIRINGLITCLQAMCRFENKRLR